MNNREDIYTLIHPGCGICLSLNQLNKILINTIAYDCDDVSQCAIYAMLLSEYSAENHWQPTHLRATNTERARCALAPNTLPKNRAATVTPDVLISSFDAALLKTLECLLDRG